MNRETLTSKANDLVDAIASSYSDALFDAAIAEAASDGRELADEDDVYNAAITLHESKVDYIDKAMGDNSK